MRFFISIFGGILIVVSLLLGYQRRSDFPQYIAFLSNRDVNSEVFLLNPETKTTKQLTFTAPPNNDEGHCWFGWTEKSLQIFAKYGSSYEPGDFYCYNGRGDISRVNLEGKLLEQQIDETYIMAPKSPNGEWYITIETPTNLDYAEIYRTHEVTGNKRLITTLENWAGGLSQIQWTNNGKWIVYIDRISEYHYALYRMRSDGSNLQQLSNPIYKPSRCHLFSISRDSEWVYLTQHDGRGVCQFLYRVKLDEQTFGTTMEMVIPEELHIDYSAPDLVKFSPNGNYLVSWDLNASAKYFVLSLETKELLFVAESFISYDLRSISWSLDSQWLAFASCEEINVICHIYRVRLDGTDLEQLTFGEHENIRPEYAPVGELDWRGELPLGIGVLLLMVGVVRKIGVR